MKSDVNGCGADGGIWKGFKPPYHMFFKASCNRHDEGYATGGDKHRRWYCDVRFLIEMLYDIRNRKRGWWQRNYYYLWARIYFLAVRLFAKNRFNYEKGNNTNNIDILSEHNSEE